MLLTHWLIGLIHEPSSLVWFSNGVVRSVISSILGAAASAILIAPMTRAAFDTARKWRPGRRFALAEELCRRVDDERELISRILWFEQDPNGLKYWKLATPRWIQQQKQPEMNVARVCKPFAAVRASCGDRQLAKILDENLQMLDKCNQVCIDRLQSASVRGYSAEAR